MGRTNKDQARALAASQGGTVSRRQLAELGVTPGMARAEVQAGRWRRVGPHALVLVDFPLSPAARWRVALAHSSPTAALDGVTALEAAGLVGFTDSQTHVSVPRGGRVAKYNFVTGHHLRSLDASHVVEMAGLPVVRPTIAAAHAALWARSERACATVLAMSVQQRLVSPAGLQLAAEALPRNARKGLVLTLAQDLASGVEALSEWEFATLCRRHGLPEPSRQRRIRRRGGNAYLDVRWDQYGVVVEIDGVHHFGADRQIAELIRHNDIAVTGDIVLRVPLVGLRITPGEFMAQVAQALRRRGWPG